MSVRLAVLAALAVALVGAGQTVRAADGASSRSDNPIAAAKKDYEAIKGSSVEGKQEKPLLPSPGVPVLDATTELTPTLSPLARQRQTDLKASEKRSKNWLLEAMAEQKSSDSKNRASTSREAKADETELTDHASTNAVQNELSPAAQLLREAQPHQTASAKSELRDKPERVETPNPLASFMAAWMSPGDFALLKPVTGSSAAGDVRSVDPKLMRKEFGGLTSDGAANVSDLQPMTRLPNSRAQADNPYLMDQGPAALAERAPGAALLSLPLQTSDSNNHSLPHPITIEQPSRVTAPANAQDFAKPDPDVKYFRQLKRF
jgi:hypothetical protein